jgi:DNA/RNA-binding domain of Phe-tRNA-synthetase-like protein
MISFSTPVIARAPQVDIGYAVLQDIKRKKIYSYLMEYQRKAIVEVQSLCTLYELKKNPTIRAFRELYWLFRMDPTKTRPSAEALARRVLAGDQFPQIDTVVDCINSVSLKYLLPISCFDHESLRGQITVRLAKEGEALMKKQGVEKVLQGGELVVADKDKIICLGFASRDSWETRIRATTKNLTVLVYQAPGIDNEYVYQCLQELCDILTRVHGGQVQVSPSFARK